MNTNGAQPPQVLRVACAQLENVVGEISGNCEQILVAMEWAEDELADVLVLPELALTGYPLEDLALRRVIAEEVEFGLRELDSTDQRVVGLEYLRASQILPGELLRMLPAPPLGVAP